MTKNNMAEVSCGVNQDVVRQTICSAFFHHAARMKGGQGEYVQMLTSMPCHIHPTSALSGLGYTPDYVVYHELIYTSKEYMQCATSVDPLWLAEYGSVFFSVKESYQSRVLKRKREKLEKELNEATLKEKEAKALAEKQKEAEEEEEDISMKKQKIAEFGARSNTKRGGRRLGI
jgi:pre-mRNA-splicing factor ATP-dependent RNA helicase DHX38/PRP16